MSGTPHPYDAEAHLAQLRAALAANGITLASLSLDPPPAASTYASPLIALGNCNLATAQALATALQKAAGRGPHWSSNCSRSRRRSPRSATPYASTWVSPAPNSSSA